MRTDKEADMILNILIAVFWLDSDITLKEHGPKYVRYIIKENGKHTELILDKDTTSIMVNELD